MLPSTVPRWRMTTCPFAQSNPFAVSRRKEERVCEKLSELE